MTAPQKHATPALSYLRCFYKLQFLNTKGTVFLKHDGTEGTVKITVPSVNLEIIGLLNFIFGHSNIFH